MTFPTDRESCRIRLILFPVLINRSSQFSAGKVIIARLRFSQLNIGDVSGGIVPGSKWRDFMGWRDWVGRVGGGSSRWVGVWQKSNTVSPEIPSLMAWKPASAGLSNIELGDS